MHLKQIEVLLLSWVVLIIQNPDLNLVLPNYVFVFTNVH
jgi:hypothetical protein